MKFRARSALLVATALAIAGCGGSDEEGGGEQETPASAAESTEESTAEGEATEAPAGSDTGDTTPAEPSGEPDPDAIFRMSYSVGPSRWDAHRASSSFDNTSLFLTYDRLVHLDKDANPVPGLATEWNFNDDGSELELKLREGVTFHDGEPFNADAVKANIERGQTVDQSAIAAELEVIDSVTVVDEYTVTLALNGPGASLPLVFSDRAGIMISPAAFENPDLDQQPVGAGMYEVTEYRPGESITYTAYPDYWDADAVNVAGIDYLIQADSTTRLNAIRDDQVDWTFVDPSDYDVAVEAGLEITQSTSLSFYHIQLNRGKAPLDNAQVRQALNYAIDRDAIIDSLLFGQAEPAVQAFPEGYMGYNEEIGKDYYTYDPDKARELLAEAGHETFEMEIIVPSLSYFTPIAEAIQAQLAEVGITMTFRTVPGEQVADVLYVEQETHGAFVPWGGRSDPSQTLYLLYSDEGFSNPGRHTTPEVMEGITETLQVGTIEERAAAVQETIGHVTEAALDVALYHQITPVVTNGRVVDYEGFMSGKPEFRGVGVVPE